MKKSLLSFARPASFIGILAAEVLLALPLGAAPTIVAKITSPKPYQVIQREGFDPSHVQMHEIGGRKLGYADVPITAELPGGKDGAVAQFRIVPLAQAFGQGGCDWTDLREPVKHAQVAATARIPAGGWYRLEVRCPTGVSETTATVEPFGVGEVLLIAGQSYAEGANQEHLKVEDPQGRVVAYDVVKKSWAVANDPFPNVNTGGTIWPAFGNYLLPLVQVPIGLVDVAVGGTASRQWMPGQDLYKIFSEAGKTLGRFRAVLWYQGDSDVIENTTTEKYFENIMTMHRTLLEEWAFAPPWIVAKSTYHPTVYNKPVQEAKVRAAQAQLWRQPGFLPGPDTDTLGGENRGWHIPYRHFSGIGQRRAGLMWFSSVWGLINTEPGQN